MWNIFILNPIIFFTFGVIIVGKILINRTYRSQTLFLANFFISWFLLGLVCQNFLNNQFSTFLFSFFPDHKQSPLLLIFSSAGVFTLFYFVLYFLWIKNNRNIKWLGVSNYFFLFIFCFISIFIRAEWLVILTAGLFGWLLCQNIYYLVLFNYQIQNNLHPLRGLGVTIPLLTLAIFAGNSCNLMFQAQSLGFYNHAMWSDVYIIETIMIFGCGVLWFFLKPTYSASMILSHPRTSEKLELVGIKAKQLEENHLSHRAVIHRQKFWLPILFLLLLVLTCGIKIFIQNDVIHRFFFAPSNHDRHQTFFKVALVNSLFLASQLVAGIIFTTWIAKTFTFKHILVWGYLLVFFLASIMLFVDNWIVVLCLMVSIGFVYGLSFFCLLATLMLWAEERGKQIYFIGSLAIVVACQVGSYLGFNIFLLHGEATPTTVWLLIFCVAIASMGATVIVAFRARDLFHNYANLPSGEYQARMNAEPLAQNIKQMIKVNPSPKKEKKHQF